MSLIYLNLENFSKNDKTLLINVSGYTFVMFVSSKSKYCSQAQASLVELSRRVKGINLASCSLDNRNYGLVELSKNTTTVIDFVPKYILYVNGQPRVEYNGKRTTDALFSFLSNTIEQLSYKEKLSYEQKGTTMSLPQTYSQPSEKPAPYKITPTTQVKEYETSYGRPFNTANEAEFLEYEQAYLQNKK